MDVVPDGRNATAGYQLRERFRDWHRIGFVPQRPGATGAVPATSGGGIFASDLESAPSRHARAASRMAATIAGRELYVNGKKVVNGTTPVAKAPVFAASLA